MIYDTRYVRSVSVDGKTMMILLESITLEEQSDTVLMRNLETKQTTQKQLPSKVFNNQVILHNTSRVTYIEQETRDLVTFDLEESEIVGRIFSTNPKGLLYSQQTKDDGFVLHVTGQARTQSFRM